MSEPVANELYLDPHTSSLKNWAWWLYFAHGICLVASLGLLSWVPLIINYLKKEETRNTFVYSHHRWQIRSFWWYVALMVLGWVLFLTFFGIPFAGVIWAVAWLWKAYRLIKGLITLNANQMMPVKRL